MGLRDLQVNVMRRSVFVSHASADKEKIEPIVRSLIRVDYKVFIDTPSHENWNFDPLEVKAWEDEDRIEFIPNAGDWVVELRKALARCDVVLVCLSNNVSGLKDVLNVEMGVADRLGKLVACSLPGTDFSAVGERAGLFRFGSAQSLMIDGEAVLAALQDVPEGIRSDQVLKNLDPQLHTFRYLLIELQKEPEDRLEKNDSKGQYISPTDLTAPPTVAIHRAGRSTQRNQIQNAIGCGGVQIRLVSGPDNEFAEAFVDALERERSDGLGDVLNQTFVARELELPEPHGNYDNYARQYVGGLLSKMQGAQGVKTELADLARFLSQRSQPTVFVSAAYACQNVKLKWKQIQRWHRFWQKVDQEANGIGVQMQVLAILLVNLDDATPGWQLQEHPGLKLPVPPDSRKLNQRIFLDFLRLERSGLAGLLGFAPPKKDISNIVWPVCPLTKEDIRKWIGDELEDVRRFQIQRQAAEMILNKAGADQNLGMTMQQFSEVAVDIPTDIGRLVASVRK